MLAWKCGLSLPLLDWDDDGVIKSYDQRYFGITRLPFSVLDGSGFLDVPVAIAVVHGFPTSGASLAVGAGAAATVAEAWLKAISEGFGVYRWLRQQTLALPAAADSLPSPTASRRSTSTCSSMRVRSRRSSRRSWTRPIERRPTAAVPPLEGSTPRTQIDAVCKRLARHGVSAFAVDVTSPDVAALGVSVARVVAPELCALDVSHRARFLGGARLYTAAHEAGLAPRDLVLADLNTLPHPFP